VIRRLYVHNFRCLENFELKLAGFQSALLIGRNGAGKSTVRKALEILQGLARGKNRLGDHISPEDFTRRQTHLPMRFEIEVTIESKIYEYALALELPPYFKEVRVAEERLALEGKPVFTRKLADVQVVRYKERDLTKEAVFGLDWHLAALPTVQELSDKDPLFIFKQFLKRMLILNPVPVHIKGTSEGENLQPTVDVENFGAWFTGLLALAPSAFSTIDRYLREIMPDIQDIKNPVVGKDSRSLIVQFKNQQGTIDIPFQDLSDGEKCYMICALVLAANRAYGPLACFWDEPDNHLNLAEVGHFVTALRKEFESGGQFIATSHHPEAIRRFSDENTFVLGRRSHLEPTIVRPLAEMQVQGDLIAALTLGDVETS
jgi:ABC-type cobalamin/Fe3+-siderophores transport system ATPase subunit